MAIEVQHGVVLGADGELFLADGHHVLEYITGKRSVSEASFEAFDSNLRTRKQLATESGARYAHLVAPDKHSVYRNKFPLADIRIIGDLYRQRTETPFLFPVERLQALAPVPAYGRTDTHWTLHGRIAIVEELMQALGLPEGRIEKRCGLLRSRIRPAEAEIVGDLGGRFTPPRTEPTDLFKPNWKIHRFSNRVSKGTQGQVILCVSGHPLAEGRLVIFGDSFLAQTLPLLTVFFKDVLFCRTPYYHREIVLGAQPDYIVSENVERYLGHVESDANAPPMLLMAPMHGRPTDYQSADAKALGAVLAGRGTLYKGLIRELDAA